MKTNYMISQWSDIMIASAALVYIIAFVYFAYDFLYRVNINKHKNTKIISTTKQYYKIAKTLTLLGCLIHAIGIIAKVYATNHAPWGNMYEFCTSGSLILNIVFLIILIKYKLRFLSIFIVGLSIIMIMSSSIIFPTYSGPLVPALQSYWLIIHVSIAIIASSIFSITFYLSLLQLMQNYIKNKNISRFLWIQNMTSSHNISYRLNTVGFILWTFTLIAGAIWAEKAWGRYWGWDVKEVWTFIIWVIYAAYLHSCATYRKSSSYSAILSIIGYLCIVFNFTIVNINLSGLHSYSGIM